MTLQQRDIMHKAVKLIGFIIFILPSLALGTTWDEVEVDDPILTGKKCQVHDIRSYGSYIYNWPSKYDQVFWPVTDGYGIWFCKSSGFTAFIHDFEKITPEQKQRIAQFLKKHHKNKSDMAHRLYLLEEIYKLRQISESAHIRLLRVLGYWYEKLDKYDLAKAYRKKALLAMKPLLDTELAEAQKLEYLYVAANYSRYLGDVKGSDQYLARLQDATAKLDNKKLTDFAQYLDKLAKQTPHIKPGKRLAPGNK